MRTWWRRPIDRVALLLGSVAAFTIAGQLLAPAAKAPETTVVVPISSLALACPALPGDIDGYDVALKSALRSGKQTARIALQTRRPANATVKPGAVRSIDVRSAAAALVSANGAAATQLVADASIVGTNTSTKGYATYACQPPSASQWLIGGSSVAGRSAVLSIANIDDAPATVNLEVWTDQGKSGARSLNGIEIPARSREQLALTLIEPGRTMYGVHVVATAGQVSAAIIDRGQAALSSLGIDVVAPSVVPGVSQVIGIIPDGAKAARIGFVSPSVPTTVRVSLLTQDGEFALAGAEAMAVDADKLNVIELPDDALAGDVAVIVRADDPVAAGAVFSLNLRGGTDLASAAAMAPIYRAASFTVDAAVSQATALLLATRPTTATIVSGFGSSQTRKLVYLKAGEIKRVKIFGGSGTSRLVAIEPGIDGVISGAVLLQRANLGMVATSVQPLLSIRGYVAVPPVAPALSR